MNKCNKILIATGIYPPEIGGPATYAEMMARELPKRGIAVGILPFREVRGYPKVFRHIMYFFKVIRLSREADIIFTQDPVSTGVPVIFASWFTGKKVVMRVAGDYAWEQARQRFGVADSIDDFQDKKYGLRVELFRCLQRFSVKHAGVVITPSNYFNRLVSGWLKNKKEIKTIYNGIELSDAFEKAPKYTDKTIITAGRMVPWKGFDVLIKILGKLPDWRLIIAGDGADKERLVDLAKQAGVEKRVEFTGNIPRTELFSKIYRSHIFALLTTFESFSFQTVEAMHVGVPVIASNIGNLSEIIDDGKNGVLVNPTDEDGVRALIEKIGRENGYAEALSREAIFKAKDFSIEKTLNSLIDVFNECVK